MRGGIKFGNRVTGSEAQIEEGADQIERAAAHATKVSRNLHELD